MITGETGAGKSLIVDSLALAAGARANSSVVRQGCKKAEITVELDVADSTVSEWLEEQELDNDSSCILRRVIYPDQVSKSFVNNTPVTTRSLKALGNHLVDIHGQHEHQNLLRQSEQRRILDCFALQSENVANLSTIATSIRRKESERNDLLVQVEKFTELRDLTAHQIETLEKLRPEDAEFSTLQSELAALSNAEALATELHGIAEQLHYAEDSAVSAHIHACENLLERSAQIHTQLEPFSKLLEEARLRVDDVARELRNIADRTEYDPPRIAAVEERMAALHQQARVHSTDPDQLATKLTSLHTQLSNYDKELSNVESIDAQIQDLKLQHQALAKQISAARAKAAKDLEQQITADMQHLGMKKGVFKVVLVPENSDVITNFGNENILFKVATNPNQEPRELSKIASGGELSRLSLAIQVNASNIAEVPSIIFDEVDVGIGGQVAESVGKLLRQLGKYAQIFCITHLPQVASCGNQQLSVIKKGEDDSSIYIKPLTHEERVSELARMLGGAKITDRATEHAKEMLLANLQ